MATEPKLITGLVSEQRIMAEDARWYFPLLLNRLQQLDLFRVILFGSYASGTPVAGSDVDLLVVLDRDDYPETWREKSDLYLQVARIIRDIRQQISIDLIVQTRTMYEKFVEMDSLFAREIQKKGEVLIESKRFHQFARQFYEQVTVNLEPEQEE